MTLCGSTDIPGRAELTDLALTVMNGSAHLKSRAMRLDTCMHGIPAMKMGCGWMKGTVGA